MDDLAARRDALRQSATAPGADLTALLDAALTELDGAIAVIGDGPGGPSPDRVTDSMRVERGLLRAAFQQAPAALFLLAADGSIRRASDRAVALLGARPGYATGKPLTAFIDPPQRAAVQTKLAAVARTGRAGKVSCRVLAPGGTAEVTLALTALELPGEAPVLAASLSPRAAGSPEGERPVPKDPGDDGRGAAGLTRRLDTVVALTRLLLDNATFSEAVTVQRCARLLAGEFADWVIVDVARGGLRRQVTAGPRGPEGEEASRLVRGAEPGPATLPAQVHETRKSVLLPHVEDQAALGLSRDGTPLLLALRATSLLAVPVADGNTSYGVLTLVRSVSRGPFTLAEQALAEDLAGHLAVSMRVDQVFRARAETAEALQASLLPDVLPELPGLELAASYVGATRWQELSGDFYDVFRTPDGWAVAMGDVSGIGQEAAAISAAARHSLRALAHVHRDPADVLSAASRVLLSGNYGERFVTALLALPEPAEGGGMRVRLANAGHPGPAVVRADGRVEIGSGTALPLGLLPDDSGPSGSVLDLAPGDVLFLYTDGVTQARGEGDEFFDDRLADALAATAGRSAVETVRGVTERLSEFCRGDYRDDVTILAIRVR